MSHLNRIAQFASRKLGVPLSTPEGPFKRFLSIQHRVFVKTCMNLTDRRHPSMLEDPDNLYERVADNWCIDMCPPVYTLADNDASTLRTSPLILTHGDFVQVVVGFDLVVSGDVTGRRTLKVFLTLKNTTYLSPEQHDSGQSSNKRSASAAELYDGLPMAFARVRTDDADVNLVG
ncbi:hypothetical protein CONPUDRAFT_155408 [Coniophora puteana RWD-64-598 SS2]|uniref:Uncharacterized protein n=1 Tax=Coniophora puteana (strain RWD-64-598) TaxID=741705 RepID=A0A5M3MLQ0_CONPW|nr:uncharacterized protein CONPUDRAFT_155408 [Coniophora puteana RWD-64-598 SS2]EIW80033.1 hypothetical protein CONPUDRAFT_155408 [Coniophora puteana RWD-64-598 SS2]